MRHYDLIIAGGGAAGIMAAGVAASAGRKVLLCERMEKPQRKVRISGKAAAT
ncbi:MAG: FAD-dependent oxidoreductase [Alistipes ihumii]